VCLCECVRVFVFVFVSVCLCLCVCSLRALGPLCAGDVIVCVQCVCVHTHIQCVRA